MTPAVLVEKQRGVIRLTACDPAAAALGLAPGLKLADARARVPEIEVVETDAHADAQWLERIADACDRFTPMVAVAGNDALTLDITGCAHLFGGEAGLMAAVGQGLERWTGHLHSALAQTPDAAQALVRFAKDEVTDEAAAIWRLPVAALGLDAETLLALRRAGLRTVGALAERPTAPLAARFGASAVDALDRLLGRTDPCITPRRALPELLFQRRFAEPIVRTEDVLALIAALAGEAARELERRHRGGRRFVVRLFRSDGRTFDLAIESGRPLRDPTRILRLFEERVQTLADPIDPGFGFDMLRFTVPHAEPLAADQLALEGGSITQEAIAALVDRLSIRLGRGRVRSFIVRDTHVPEQAALTLPVVEAAQPQRWPAPEPGEPPLRPIHLFDPPQPVDVIAELPDGPPRRFRWRRILYDVTRYDGPERIAPEWWRRQPGMPGLTRDYFRIEDIRGRRFWLFRHGLYERETSDPRWYVHGLFA